MKLKILKSNSLIVPIILYLFISFSAYLIKDGNISSLTSDFNLYNRFNCEYFTNQLSELAQYLCRERPFLDFPEWQPTPIYSVLFLAPITFLGSERLFFLLGLFIGISILIEIDKFLKNKFEYTLEKKDRVIINSLLILNYTFIIQSISVTTISVASWLCLLALNSKSRIFRVLFFISAATIRSNYLIAVIVLLISLFYFKPKGYKKIYLDLIPSIIVYFIYFKLFYSGYPGSKLNYILLGYGSGFNEIIESANIFASKLTGLLPSESYGKWNLSLNDLIKLLLSNQEAFNMMIQTWFLKLFNSIGFFTSRRLISSNNIYFISSWITIYSFFITIPGFFYLL